MRLLSFVHDISSPYALKSVLSRLADYTQNTVDIPARLRTKWRDPETKPFSRFLFRYRPRGIVVSPTKSCLLIDYVIEMLQAQGIMPLPSNEEGGAQGNKHQPEPSPRDDQAHRRKRRRPTATEGGADSSSPTNDALPTSTEEDVKPKLEDADVHNMVDDSLSILKVSLMFRSTDLHNLLSYRLNLTSWKKV